MSNKKEVSRVNSERQWQERSNLNNSIISDCVVPRNDIKMGITK